ncbi:hypothetical protein EDC02_5145 [Micromonospora sp. Llam0]|uniref:hypothetical protein n=1 Tax=Micromonospora sp. Llam0 TaxID=2485143 RepID=UPI000F47E9A7|nr:hypothetical protein [Micromonospora sp. Llam0]ROO63128.1 hypothetical protein EDC02_5145 [Micromonospora sp. Llam0]
MTLTETTSNQRSHRPVTRVEIADFLDTAFDAGPVGGTDLARVAQASGARAELVTLLAELPEQNRYARLRQLWEDLPDVPLGA